MEYEKQYTTIPSTSDPAEFMNDFLESPTYDAAFNQFYEGKNINPSVTAEMRHRVFQEKEEARLALVKFAQKKLHFKYNPEKVGAEVNEAADAYVDSAQQLKKAQLSGERDRIISQDAYRASVHQTLADRIFLAQLAPSKNLGLGVAGLILVSKGLQTYDSLLIDRRETTQARYR